VGVDKDIVESLEGGDFKCGDIVTFVVVQDVKSIRDRQAVEDDCAASTVERWSGTNYYTWPCANPSILGESYGAGSPHCLEHRAPIDVHQPYCLRRES
jgi:hypothetical protein